MEEVKTYQDEAEEVKKRSIEEVREMLRKAADIKNPREMWFTVRNILDLLALIIVPEPEVILPSSV